MKNIRKVLAIIMAVAMCFSMFSHTAFANATTVAEGTAGENVTWVLTDDGVLTISGTGEINTEWYAPPWKEYNESITEVVVEDGITKISDTAFCYAENLVTVSIPSTLTYVSGWAFYVNYALEEINVAEANTAYKSIDGILFTEDEKTLVAYPANKACEEYTIPASVTTIGEMAFTQCAAVDKVIVPDTVTTLAKFAFEYSQIKEVEIGNGVTEYSFKCFAYSRVEKMIIPDSVETISEHAFASTNYLNTLIIGSGVKNIDKDILTNADELTAIHYKGTQEDWDTISIHEENEDFNSKELHFILGDIKEGTEATCADGHTAGYYCDTCEDYLTGEVIPAIDEHDWNNGVCDGCSEVCGHTDEDFDEKCDVCELDIEYKEVEADETNTVYIPEEYGEVVVKFTPTESGWYAVVSDNGGDDENNDPYVGIFDADGEEVAYNDDNYNEDTYNFYCEFEAEAGETYYIVLSNYFGDVEYDYTIEKHVGIDHQPTAAEPYVTLTWDVEAEYQWYLLDGDEEVAIDGETEATLKNPKIGSEYGCLVTYNGVEIYSDILFYGYAITHQPTAEEPYVELNDDTDATYQWYVAKEGKVELTDENTTTFPSEDEGPIYDAEKGWSGIYVGTAEIYDCYAYFIVPLKKGETISIELSGDYYGRVEFEDVMLGGFIAGEVDEDGKCEFTAKKDGFYAVYAYRDVDGDEVFVKAYMDGYEYTKIEGATSAEYTPTEDGLYACEVTFADDSTEMSRVFEKKTVPAGEDDNTGGNADNDENTKPAPKPEIPNTDATVNNANSNGWFAVMLTLSMGLALVMTNKKSKIRT